MLHSIRWRLTASFILLTLLTVSLLGLIVLRLMQRSLERQMSDYLRANAQAVARQSQALFVPVPQQARLAQLAQTTAFLSDVQVRIWDNERQLLVDAGAPGTHDELTWVFQSAAAIPGQPLEAVVMFAPEELARPASPLPPSPGDSPAGGAISVRRLPSPWGDRLFFHPPTLQERMAASAALSHVVITETAVGGVLPFSLTVDAPFEVVRSPLQVTTTIEAGNQILGYVELSSPPDFVPPTLAVIRRAFLLAAAGVTLLSVVLGLVVSHGLTAPLAGLASATARMNSGDLSARAPIHGHDEIGLLAGQFNQMAAALEASFAALAAERDALRRFVADASHELRTPITALRTFFDLLLGGASRDPAAQQEFLQESQNQIERLERITNNLLNLSRLEGGLIQLRFAVHDLGELLLDAVAPFKPLAGERQIDLRVASPLRPLLIRCDRSQLETALTNLIDNALKFTPAGGQVQVGAELDSTGVCLWVKDSGPGIAADEVAYIFERFHRGRSATAGGSGLGLAIVQGVVQAHGGQVEVVSQVGVGSRFAILLPPVALATDQAEQPDQELMSKAAAKSANPADC